MKRSFFFFVITACCISAVPVLAQTNPACNLLPASEQATCLRRISEEEAACAKRGPAYLVDSCLNLLKESLKSCGHVQPQYKGDCVRAALRFAPPVDLTACDGIPSSDRSTCIQGLTKKQSECVQEGQRSHSMEAPRKCVDRLNVQLSHCKSASSADDRDACIRTAAGIPPTIPPGLTAAKVCAMVPAEERNRCAQKFNEKITSCAQASPVAVGGQVRVTAPSACFKEFQNRVDFCSRQSPTGQAGCVRSLLGLPTPIDLCRSIAILSPRGGENWVEGSTQTIRWSNTGTTPVSVNIGLLRGGSVAKVLSSNLSVAPGGSGSFNWLVADPLIGGSNYAIKLVVSSPDGRQCEMTSGALTLTRKK